MAKEKFRLELNEEDLKKILTQYVSMKYGFKSEISNLKITEKGWHRNNIIFEGQRMIPDENEYSFQSPEVITDRSTFPNIEIQDSLRYKPD